MEQNDWYVTIGLSRNIEVLRFARLIMIVTAVRYLNEGNSTIIMIIITIIIIIIII